MLMRRSAAGLPGIGFLPACDSIPGLSDARLPDHNVGFRRRGQPMGKKSTPTILLECGLALHQDMNAPSSVLHRAILLKARLAQVNLPIRHEITARTDRWPTLQNVNVSGDHAGLERAYCRLSSPSRPGRRLFGAERGAQHDRNSVCA